MAEKNILLKEVPSGKIHIVFNGIYSTLRFDCSCLDALPFCQAMCCRMRSGYAVVLRKDEAEKFDSVKSSVGPILRRDPKDDSCVYLNKETCLCHTHQDKPSMCRAWHCSPEGERDDPGIKVRGAGWFLSPMMGQEEKPE